MYWDPVKRLAWSWYLTHIFNQFYLLRRWVSGKESACSAGATGDMGSVPGLGRSPGGRDAKPLQVSCLKISMDRRAWWATVHRAAKSQTRVKRLGTCTHNSYESHLLLFFTFRNRGKDRENSFFWALGQDHTACGSQGSWLGAVRAWFLLLSLWL